MTLINLRHKAVTIPSASPIGVVEVDIKVYARAALDPTSKDPYERLSDQERELIDKIDVDAGKRLSEAERLRVRTLLARRVKLFALNPKDPVHTHLLEVELPLKEGTVPHRHAASRLCET